MIKSFEEINNNAFYDIIVVGSGAAGISLSLEFNKSNIKVALIEAGNLDYSEENQALLKVQSRGPLKHAPLDRYRIRQFGGTTNIWGAGIVKYDELDFIARQEIKIDGWPYKIEKIEKYYRRARRYVGLDDTEFTVNSRKNSIYPGIAKSNRIEERNLLRNKRGVNFNKIYLNEYKKSDNITLYINSILTNIIMKGSSVQGIEISNLSNTKKYIKGGKIILCCGGVENTRLLLNFNRKNNTNIGNSQNALGRYYSTHINLYNGLLLTQHNLNNDYIDINNLIHEKKFISFNQKFSLENKFLNSKTHLDLKVLNSKTPLLTEEISQLLSGRNKNSFAFELNSQFEQSPCYTSRIELTDEKDKTDLYKAEVYYDINDSDIDIYNKMYHNFGLAFGALNIGRLYFNNVRDIIYKELIGFSHHIGTTRIETKSYGGSVNEELNVINTDNLYCLSSSCFPTTSHANPTYTIIALGIKLADYLKAKE